MAKYLINRSYQIATDEIKSKKEKKPIVDYDVVHVTIPISGELSVFA